MPFPIKLLALALIICSSCGVRSETNATSKTSAKSKSATTASSPQCSVPQGILTATFQGDEQLILSSATGPTFTLEREGETGNSLYSLWNVIHIEVNGASRSIDALKKQARSSGIGIERMQFRFVEQGRLEAHSIYEVGGIKTPCLAAAQATYQQTDGGSFNIVSQGATTKL